MSLGRLHIVRWLVGTAVALSALALLSHRAWAETEYEAKAKWIVGFAQYTTWRDDDFPSKDSPFVFGILGDSPFGKEIELLKKWRAQNRQTEVRVGKSVEAVGPCQILFICSSETRNLAKILKSLNNRRTLTISDADGFIQEGGMVRLIVKQTS